ncbi:MAG: hypothetical protein GWP15_02210 [Nitrospirae bacterium]|nr:hypothetical protein [Nitrospirota bacterium]
MENLHKKFVQLGRQKFKLTNEMLHILPEIYESGIYKKFASTIVEYAGKFGGIPRSTVEKRLRIEKHLYDKPKLKEAIKTVGLNKVAMVVTLATPENEGALAYKIGNMSKPAVQTLSKELRQKNAEGLSGDMICEAKPEKIKLELDEEMTFLFLKLKKKWGGNMSNREVMGMILGRVVEAEFARKNRKTEMESVPTAMAGSSTGENSTKERGCGETAKPKAETRYVSAHKRWEELGDGKCKYPGCNKPAEVFHHRDRFSQSRSHESIIALCHDHHEFMHNGLVDEQNWRLDVRGQVDERADIMYRKCRQKMTL